MQPAGGRRGSGLESRIDTPADAPPALGARFYQFIHRPRSKVIGIETIPPVDHPGRGGRAVRKASDQTMADGTPGDASGRAIGRGVPGDTLHLDA